MMLSRRTVYRVFLAVAGVFLICGIAGWWILRSNWLREEVRRAIIAELERATGGKAELGRFDYNGSALTADVYNLVIHGTEPADSAPLLRVEHVRIGFRIISIFERSIDLSSLVADRPRVNLLVAPDGSTNIPSPRIRRKRNESVVEELLRLRVKHFEVNQGAASVNNRHTPFAAHAEEIQFDVHYRAAPESYSIQCNTPRLEISSGSWRSNALAVNTEASLERNRLSLQKMTIVGNDSSVEINGSLTDFTNPKAAAQLKGTASVREWARSIGWKDLTEGRVDFNGSGSYDESGGPSFHGKVEAHGVSYYARGLSGIADLVADRAGLTFSHITATGVGARFTGKASLKNFRALEIEGAVAGVDLQRAAAFVTDRPVAWNGTASGRVRETAGIWSAQLHIVPASTGIPVNGDVDLEYVARYKTIRFGNSQLYFPNSQVSFSGEPKGETAISASSSNLEEFRPVLALGNWHVENQYWPVLISGGNARFEGSITGATSTPEIRGRVDGTRFHVLGQDCDQLASQFSLNASSILFDTFSVQQGAAKAEGSGSIGLTNWIAGAESPLQGTIRFNNVDVNKTVALFSNVNLPIIRGVAAGAAHLKGTLGRPEGTAHVASDSLDAYGEQLNKAQFDASLEGDQLRITNGQVAAGPAILKFSGDYLHNRGDWVRGRARIHADSNGFPIERLTPVRKYQPGLDALAEIHLDAGAAVSPEKVEPSQANGSVDFRNITYNGIAFGDLVLRADTHGEVMDVAIQGDLRKSPVHGKAQVQLNGDNQATGDLTVERIGLGALYSLSGYTLPGPFNGFTQGEMHFEGPLQKPAQLKATLRAAQLELSSQIGATTLGKPVAPDIVLHNTGPILIEAGDGAVTVRQMKIEGESTSVAVSGSVPFSSAKRAALNMYGSVNLRVFHLFDTNVAASGVSVVSVAVGGSVTKPAVNGALEIKDGAFSLDGVPNGLSAVNGVVTFNETRAVLQKMTARSGGGELSLGGFVSFARGPLVYHLESQATNVRVRYAGAISVTSSSKLRLSGTSGSSLLSGTITIARVVFNPNTDVGNLLASLGAAGTGPVSSNEFLGGLHFDIGVESAPNLQLNTSLSRDVQAEINLRMRGTPEHPVLAGNLAANQGDIQVFGTRYSINRGEISFVNPVRIEPVLDLDLETRARGITVDITISGGFNKLNITYRSDPPLQPRDIIALLAVGRDPVSATQTPVLRTSDTRALQSGANTLLGAAVTTPVSNRLSKLFGITNIKIDPLVQGITNTPQARVTLEQQISKDITITYVTNLSQTSEQIFRLEWALNRQFSVIALRDDNGEFGIDFLYKKRFK